MAGYAPNFTRRLKISYTSLGQNSTMQLRLAPGVDQEAAQDFLHDAMANIAANFHTSFAFVGAELCNQGENFFLPVPLATSLANFAGTSSGSLENVREFRTCAVQFVGKSLIGNPWRLSIYGAIVAPYNSGGAGTSDDFRINASDVTAWNDAIIALQGAANSTFVANDGNPFVLRPYVNIVISRYRINRIRKFG